MENERSTNSSGADWREMILDLNFVPEWARRPADEVRYAVESEKPDTPSRASGRKPSDRRVRRAPAGAASPSRPGPPRGRPREPLPRMRVRFLPERGPLAQVIHKIRLSRRFYPLVDIAELFLAQPDSCYVHLDIDPAADRSFVQCRICGMVDFREEEILSHLATRHLDRVFRIEEEETEPPSGKFTCVARCTLGGEWIGPPNHNTYQERLREIHHTKYASMPFAEFTQHVETRHDEEAIEAWKKTCTRRRVYILENAEDGTDRRMTYTAARAHFLTSEASRFVRETRTAVLPSRVARRLENLSLMHFLSRAWQRENAHPHTLLVALRGAFKAQNLFVFKTGRDMVFVGSVKPSPLDPGHVVDSIREVLLYLQDHPGSTRAQLLEHLRPGQSAEAPEVRDVLTSLSWLVEKGHIIEFYNGTLAIPMT